MSEPQPPQSHFTAAHRWMTTINLVLAIAAMIAVLTMVNYLAAGHFKRFQWANSGVLELSPQTLRVLNSLTNTVTVTIYMDPQRNQDIYSLVSGLLEEYQNASPRIHVVGLDYERFPGEANALKDRLHLSSSQKDFIAFETTNASGGTQSKICYANQLSDYNIDEVLTGQSRNIRRSSFLGEIFFTSDIFAVSNPRELKAYFLAGHGERNPGDPSGQGPKPPENGYSKLAAILKNEINCNWQTLTLTGTNPVPADCNLLIIATSRGEEASLASNELAQIQAYLKHGGRLLALLDTTEGLDPVLQEWGVMLGPMHVVDEDKKIGQFDFLATIAMDPHGTIHPIVKPMASGGLMTLRMLAPRPIFTSQSAPKSLGAPTLTPLAATGTNGIEIDVDHPRRAQYALIGAIEQGVINSHDGTRIVIAGDADFLDDQMIDSGAANHYFAAQTLNWLLQRPDIVLGGLGPRPVKDYKLNMTESQTARIGWIFLAAMPGSALFLGCLVWLRRRS